MVGRERTATYAGNVVLPLERETVFLAASEGQKPGYPERPLEIRRPSSSIWVLTSNGADTGLELFTLRPRSAADWLARTHRVSNGEFMDGSRLLGVDAELRENQFLDVSLYWELHPPLVGRPDPDRVRLGLADRPADGIQEGIFPTINMLRKDYLLMMQFRLAVASREDLTRPFRLTLLDRQAQPIRIVGGDVALDLSLSWTAR
jgi:hypothetical protein